MEVHIYDFRLISMLKCHYSTYLHAVRLIHTTCFAKIIRKSSTFCIPYKPKCYIVQA